MTVVSDTSPLNYLTLVGLEHLLPTLFGRVIIPLAVQKELEAPGRAGRDSRFVGSKQTLARSRGCPVPCPTLSLPAWIQARKKRSLSPLT